MPTLRTLLALPLLLAPVAPSPARPTGVIVVVLDDVSPKTVAKAVTPRLDELAANGRTYPVAWGAPACSSARAQIVSGRFAFRPDNRTGSNCRVNGLHELASGPKLVPARVTAAGLTATHLGKWHLAPAGRLTHPLECGYSHAAGTEGNLTWGGHDYFDWLKVVDGEASPRSGYITSDTIDDALEEVEAGTDLIVVWLHAPHSPHHCPPAELAPGTTCDASSGLPEMIQAMMEAADTEIGRLADCALPAGYTLIVTADNGPGKDVGGKYTVYESGLRVPAIVVGEGVVPGVSATRFSVLDIGPTVLDLLEVPYEEGWFDGVSLASELGGGPAPVRYLYAEYFLAGGPIGLNARRAIRDEQWKLHAGPGFPPDEFYDLRTDPDETNDLLLGTLTAEQAQALETLRRNLPQ